MSQETERRPVVAAFLSFLQPGLGHLYLREWLRAFLWAGLWLGSFAAVAASAGIELASGDSVAALFGVPPWTGGVPTEVVLWSLAVAALATLDAAWLAARNNHRLQSDIGRCRDCGQELDPTLEFCHWCTARQDDEEFA